MDNLEKDILALFKDDSASARASDGARNDSRSKSHHKRRRHDSRRSSFSGSENDGSDMDIDSADSVASDNEPLDEWGEDLMGDHKDRQRLMALTEIERERILAERQERRDVLNEQRELRMKLKAGVRVSGDDSRARGSSRNKKGSAFSDLKRARERRRHGSPDRWSSASDSAQEDEEQEEEANEPLATLDEINNICMSRNQLENWLFRPFLAEAITGCFVRIVTRTRDSSGEYNQYKMMQIVDVIQGEGRDQPPYHLNKTLTDKYLILRYGAVEKEYSMETISNSPIKAEELDAWNTALRTDRMRTRVTSDVVMRKIRDLERAREYKLTEAEITQMVNERARLRQIESGGIAAGDLALERTHLNRQKKDAQRNEDWAQLKIIEEKLAKLDKIAEKQKTDVHQQSSSHGNKALLAPSTSRYGSSDGRGSAPVRRNKLLSPGAGGRSTASPMVSRNMDHQHVRSMPQYSNMTGAPSSRLISRVDIPQLVLKPKITQGYADIMANDGFDMSFVTT
ncbi:RNA polymerase-associated protein rtf1 [Coemansia sp. Benny D115]|nr:RNA polymerase-associated protein rtf1 [Coemansia sp. Benny D115]